MPFKNTHYRTQETTGDHGIPQPVQMTADQNTHSLANTGKNGRPWETTENGRPQKTTNRAIDFGSKFILTGEHKKRKQNTERTTDHKKNTIQTTGFGSKQKHKCKNNTCRNNNKKDNMIQQHSNNNNHTTNTNT
jgi:hypothetical protein